MYCKPTRTTVQWSEHHSTRVNVTISHRPLTEFGPPQWRSFFAQRKRPPSTPSHRAFDGFGGRRLEDMRRFMHGISNQRRLRHHWRRNRRIGDKDWMCNRRFGKIDKDSGKIKDAINGNELFNTGGKDNEINDVGKVVLDKILSGEDRKVKPLDQKPIQGEVDDVKSFGLNFKKERDRCLSERTLFEDPEFPAESKSLYYQTPPRGVVEWKRPHDIVDDPCFIVGGESRFDVVQGQLGDCWLLAAVANLTLRDELFYRVVPPDQSFTENYAGIFHFRFWRYGEWVEVVIDDKLPTINGKLIYLRSDKQNEFWSALVEKAYAKMFTCYECLDGGLPMDALVDFTGGLTEHFDLRQTDKETLLAVIIRGFQMGSFFCSSLNSDAASFQIELPNGLIRGHAYSITAIQTVPTTRGDVTLLRIRNPWGNNKEWKGGWSDNSSLWDTVSDLERRKLDVTFSADGEFWIAFDDFHAEFEQLEVCNLSADVESEIEEMTGVVRDDGAETGVWQEDQRDGVWSVQRGTAGGCINFIESFWRNPQFLLQLTKTAHTIEHDDNCTVVVALMQKYRRELRIKGKQDLTIGFSIFQAPAGLAGPLPKSFFYSNRTIAKVPVFTNMREVTLRFRVPPGAYVIIPSTFEPHQDAEFLLRAYCNGDLKLSAL